jgi:hypothetical protein
VFPSPEVLLRSEITFWPEENSLVFAISVPVIQAADNLLSAYRLEVRRCALE